MVYIWDPELSDREVHFIGMISVQWSSLEHTIFIQTLETFMGEVKAAHELPKEMNNIQFTGVLELWKERVAEKARGQRARVLLEQYDAVLELKPARDALAHGMWDWSLKNHGEISTVRVKKREVITSKFTADALGDIARRAGEINFKVRFPGGLIDHLRELEKNGYSAINRRLMATLTGYPVGNYGLPIDYPGNGSAPSNQNDA